MFGRSKIQSKKVGLPPGTLIHVGERKVEKTRIRIMDYDEKLLDEMEPTSIEACLEFIERPTITWINIDGLHEVDLIEKIGRRFSLHPLVLEDIAHTEQRPKLEDYEDYLFIVCKMLFYDQDKDEIVVEQFPEESSYNLTLAKLYLNHENDEGAIREFERASETDLKKRDGWIEARDNILNDKGGEDPQVVQYNQQIDQIEGQIRDELSTLEILYKRNDMGVQLVDVYLKYLKLNPDDTQAMLNLAKKYYDIGEHGKSEEVLTELIEMEPDNVEAYFYLGRCCLSMKKSREAIDAYKKVVELDPENKKGYADLASAYNEIGQPDVAERYVKRALNLDPNYGYAHVVYGEIYEARGQPYIDDKGNVPYNGKVIFQSAVDEFKKALKDPEWRAYAEGKISYLIQFTPTPEDEFFQKGKKPKK